MNTDQPPYILELQQAAEHDIRILTEKWRVIDGRLAQKIEEAGIRVREAENARQSAKRVADEADRHYRDIYSMPPPAGIGGNLWYWLLIAGLFICEFPINAIVFRLFGEAEVFTYIATGAIAISLLACAHLLGDLLRNNWGGRMTVPFVVGLIVVPALVIGAVAMLRERYLSQVVEGAETTWSSGTLFTFAAFNLIIYVVATVGSYLAHNRPLLELYRARRRAEAAQKEFEHADTEQARANARRQSVRDTYRTIAHQIKDTAQMLMQVYRAENLRNRTDREQYEQKGSHQPESFKRENQPSITIELDNLP